MAQITSRIELEKWLQGKPADWAQVIAARAALRVLPYAFGERIGQKRIDHYALNLIRATFMSWAALNYPDYKMIIAVRAARDATSSFAAASAAARAATAAANSIDTPSNAGNASAIAADNAAGAAINSSSYTNYSTARNAAWASISHDTFWLESEGTSSSASCRLTREEVWLAGEAMIWNRAWNFAVERFRELNQGYEVWIDWYNRRVEGNDAAFDIPGDTGRTEDKAILARLADATNEDFWDKGAVHVNTTLQGWIDEARARVAEPSEPEAQNTNVIQFRQNDVGQFDPDFTAGTDELLTDQAAYDRHHAFVTTAQEALSLCRGHNQIGHVAEHLTIVIDAAGDQPPAMRVDLLVARGERMVDDLGDAITELQPDPKVALDNLREKRIVNAFKALIRDYTAMIKLDPALDRRQRLPLDDEASASAVSPQQAIIFVNSSLIVGAITQSARDVIVENAADVPENGDINNRGIRRFFEIVRNLPRAMISFLWQNRGKIAGGLAASVAGLGTAAITLITQEAAIRSFFATNPGMLSIIDELTTLIRNIGM
jgi:hypothetical protein